MNRERLDKLNFRLPIPAAVAAPARHLPRPIACTVQGGLKLKQWWTIDCHNTPAHLLPLTHLITSVRDEGGACIVVVMASLSVGDLKRLRRNLVEITELAHLFSENFCVLCGFIDEGWFGGLKAVVTRHKDASLVCAGLQALQLKDRVEEQLSSQYRISQHGAKASAKASDCKVADLEELQPLVDRAMCASNSISVACPCAADHQITPKMTTQSITRLEAANKAPAPYDVTHTSNTVRREWAHHILWAAVMGEEFPPTLTPTGQRRCSSFTPASSRKPLFRSHSEMADRATKLFLLSQR